MRKTICALSLGPAVDKTIYVDDFTVDAVNRAKQVISTPGSKGVNVARLLAKCGMGSVCFGFVGGENGKYITSELKKDGVKCDFILVSYDARTNIKLVDLKNGTYTDINLASGAPSDKDIEKLKIKTRELCKKSSLIVLGGSIGQGVDSSIYYELALIAKSEGALVAIDSVGEPLMASLKAKPFIIKPNIDELETTFGEKYDTTEKIIKKATELYNSGVENVLVSLGKRGAVAVCKGSAYKLGAIDTTVYNTVGAGDAFLSGFIYAHALGLDVVDCLKHSISFSTTVVSSSLAKAQTLENLTKYLDAACVEQIF